MKRLLFSLFLFSSIILFSLKPEIVRAGGGEHLVRPILVIPSDWRSKVTPDIESRYKQNILTGLEEIRQFYASKLEGHTFKYDSNIQVVDASGRANDINLNDINCVADFTTKLGLGSEIFNPSIGVNALFVIGSKNIVSCGGSYNPDVGVIFISHQITEQLGDANLSLKRPAFGTLGHELGHGFGLVYTGWAKAHPCSWAKKNECLDIPGLGTTIPYPPASELFNSLVGTGWTKYPGSVFNNSIYNPEVKKLFNSPFINPNGDSAPSPKITQTKGAITQVSPNPITVGNELRITGSGFGLTTGDVKLLDASSNSISASSLAHETRVWTDSDIKIFINQVFPEFTKVNWQLSVTPKSGNEEILYPQLLAILPNPSIMPSPISTFSPFPSISPTPTSTPGSNLGKIISIFPNELAAGDQVVIAGSGFGVNPGRIEFTEVISALSFNTRYEVKSWTDSEIKILLLEEIKRFPASISVLTSSGEKIVSSQLIHPKTNIATSTPSPTTLEILSLYPNPITVGELLIGGKGFGSEKGVVTFSNSSGSFSTLSDYFEVRKWIDNEIIVYIAKPLNNKTESWVLSVDTKSGKRVNTTLTINAIPTPPPSPSPVASLSPSPSPSPVVSATPSPTPSPSTITQIKISNYKDFRSDNPYGEEGSVTSIFTNQSSSPIIWKKSTLSPNSPIYITSINPDGTNREILEVNLTDNQLYQIGNFIIQAKVIKKIVKMQVNSQEYTSNFNQVFSIHLPGTEGVAGNYQVPMIITYNDGTTKSLLFTFNYKPQTASTPTPSPIDTQEAVCNAKGGICSISCSSDYPSQVGVCSNNQLCCAKAVATPAPNASKCQGSSPAASGWGGSCKVGESDKAVLASGGTACSVASCYFKLDINEYCWYNSGTPYADYEGCKAKGVIISTPAPSPTPVSSSCPDITCSVTTDSSGYKAGVPVTNGGGAGGTCTYGDPIQGKNSNIGQCTSFKCPSQPGGVPGHTVSVCQSNNCYANSCECWPDSACP